MSQNTSSTNTSLFMDNISLNSSGVYQIGNASNNAGWPTTATGSWTNNTAPYTSMKSAWLIAWRLLSEEICALLVLSKLEDQPLPAKLTVKVPGHSNKQPQDVVPVELREEGVVVLIEEPIYYTYTASPYSATTISVGPVTSGSTWTAAPNTGSYYTVATSP